MCSRSGKNSSSFFFFFFFLLFLVIFPRVESTIYTHVHTYVHACIELPSVAAAAARNRYSSDIVPRRIKKSLCRQNNLRQLDSIPSFIERSNEITLKFLQKIKSLSKKKHEELGYNTRKITRKGNARTVVTMF